MDKMGETERRTYVCKRARMASYLMKCGFQPYRIAPDHSNPMYNVFLFTATPALYEAVTDYITGKERLK